jgi:hypothetical protein
MVCAQLEQCGGAGLDLLVFSLGMIRTPRWEATGRQSHKGAEPSRTSIQLSDQNGRVRQARLDGGPSIAAKWRAD